MAGDPHNGNNGSSGVRRRRLFVHIGTYKTGTTSIQNLLDHNRPHLHAYGTYYPSTGRHPRSHVQHTLLAQSFLPQSHLDPDLQLKGYGLGCPIDRDLLFRALLHEIDLSGCRNIILSTEVFFSILPESIPLFLDYFRDFDVVPILYIRNFTDMAENFYQTALIHGRITCTFEDYGFETVVRLDLYELCRQWAKHAFNGKIHVEDYDAPGNDDVTRNFLGITGLQSCPLDNSVIAERHNPSAAPAIVTIVRELRRVNVSDARIDKFIRDLGRLDYGRSESVIPDATRRRLHDRYLEELQKLRSADFVEGLPQQDWDRPDFRSKTYIANLRNALSSVVRARVRMRRRSAVPKSCNPSHRHPTI